ncbi:MAG: LLM class flavin-dependent oxidoreductase [Planctomycetota bacterium]
MRFGYWLPVFGGWLRNIEDERMTASWGYASTLAQLAEEQGYDLTLIAELNNNDIKGVDAPTLDAWSTAAALAAVTRRQEIMVAVRPTFHEPALFAKRAANIDHISGGRLSLNLVSAWWASEAKQFGVGFDHHDRRYQRSSEWLDVVRGIWRETPFSHRGEFYSVEDAIAVPKPASEPKVYAGGESPAGKEMIANKCDAYLMHGDHAERLACKIEDMAGRRDRLGLPPLHYGVAAYIVCRDTLEEAQAELARITDVRATARGFENYQEWLANTKLDRPVSVQEYSVSNRGLETGLIGTPEIIAERITELKAAGIGTVLLQCSPQAEELQRVAESVFPLVRDKLTQVQPVVA